MRRLTQRDLARQTGLSQSTISRALANHPSSTPATCDRILQVAKQGGYAISPFQRAWVENHRNSARHQTPIFGHICDELPGGHALFSRFQALLVEMTRRVTALGTRMEVIRTNPQGMTLKRATDILFHRGIPILICGPFAQTTGVEKVELNAFSVVGIGNSPSTEKLDRVEHDRYQTMRDLMKQLVAAGYQRPALVGFEDRDNARTRGWLQAFRYEQSFLDPRDAIVPIPIPSEPDMLGNWIREHRPDVVLSPAAHLASMIRRNPRRCAFVALDQNSPLQDKTLAATLYPIREIAQAVVDLAIAKCDQHQTGLSDSPQIMSYRGGLLGGTSCPEIGDEHIPTAKMKNHSLPIGSQTSPDIS